MRYTFIRSSTQNTPSKALLDPWAYFPTCRDNVVYNRYKKVTVIVDQLPVELRCAFSQA